MFSAGDSDHLLHAVGSRGLWTEGGLMNTSVVQTHPPVTYSVNSSLEKSLEKSALFSGGAGGAALLLKEGKLSPLPITRDKLTATLLPSRCEHFAKGLKRK